MYRQIAKQHGECVQRNDGMHVTVLPLCDIGKIPLLIGVPFRHGTFTLSVDNIQPGNTAPALHQPATCRAIMYELNVALRKSIPNLSIAFDELAKATVKVLLQPPTERALEIQQARVALIRNYIYAKQKSVNGVYYSIHRKNYYAVSSANDLLALTSEKAAHHLEFDENKFLERGDITSEIIFHKLLQNEGPVCAYSGIIVQIQRHWSRASIERIDNDDLHSVCNTLVTCLLLNGVSQMSRPKLLFLILLRNEHPSVKDKLTEIEWAATARAFINEIRK